MASKRIAFLVDLANSFGRRVLQGVHSHPASQHWSVLAESWGDVNRQELLREGSLHGIILKSEDPELLAALQSFSGPVVDLSGGLRHPFCSTVTADYVQVGRVGAEHLKDRGFLHVAFVGMHHRAGSAQIEKGFRQVVDDFAGKINRYTVAGQPDLRDDLAAWVAALPRPCGILAAEDVAARHLLQACHTLNLKVPQQLAVLGVGDDETITTISVPSLSSVVVPATEIGMQAADCLHRLFQNQADSQHLKLACPSVAARRSTDALAWEDPLMRNALEWLSLHARAETLRVPALAQHLSVSRRLLEQRFHASLGHGPAEQLRRFRLRRAEALLRETDLGLGMIAKLSGLATAERLCVLFRRYLQLTPGSYRKLLGQPRC